MYFLGSGPVGVDDLWYHHIPGISFRPRKDNKITGDTAMRRVNQEYLLKSHPKNIDGQQVNNIINIYCQ